MCLRSKGLPPDTRPPAPLAKAGPQAETLGPVFHLSDNAVFEVEIIERPDRCRRSLVDLQRSAVGLIPKRNVAPHPEPLAFGGCDLVTDPFRRDLALEPGEAQEHVECQTPPAGGGIERLGNRHEGGVCHLQPLVVSAHVV